MVEWEEGGLFLHLYYYKGVLSVSGANREELMQSMCWGGGDPLERMVGGTTVHCGSGRVCC